MHRLPLLALLTAPIFVGCSDAPSVLDPALIGQRSSAIVHGSVDPGHPAVGLLHIKWADNTGSYCTGGLVGSRTVLTAAHCVVKGKSAPFTGPKSIHFYINGQVNAFGQISGTKYTMASAAYHGSYSYPATGPPLADVGVVRLSQTVTGVQPMLVDATPTYVGEGVVLVGYGKTGKEANDSGTKRTAQNAVEKLKTNYFTYKGASGSEGNTCSGDSGSSVFAVRNGVEVIIGIHSAGTCALDDNPATIEGFAGRADVYYSWIDTAAQGDLYKGGSTGPTDTQPPTVTITSPQQGAQVQPSFQLAATVQDDGTIAMVRFFVDGQQVGQTASPPYSVAIKGQLAGIHDLEVRAEDATGKSGSASARVTVFVPVPLGAPCSSDAQCESKLCVPDPAGGYCSRPCTNAAQCAGGYRCEGVCLKGAAPQPSLDAGPGPSPGPTFDAGVPKGGADAWFPAPGYDAGGAPNELVPTELVGACQLGAAQTLPMPPLTLLLLLGVALTLRLRTRSAGRERRAPRISDERD